MEGKEEVRKKRKFVGECFVAGFMDGEGLFEIFKGTAEEEWVELI